MRLLRGNSGPVPTVSEAQKYAWTPLERYEVAQTRRVVAGSPQTVRTKIEALVDGHRADEAMIVTIAPDYASRERSYELLAGAFATNERAGKGRGPSRPVYTSRAAPVRARPRLQRER